MTHPTQTHDHELDPAVRCQRCSGGTRTDRLVVICLICELELATEEPLAA